MADEELLSSDSEDEDYVPNLEEDDVSEENEDGEPEYEEGTNDSKEEKNKNEKQRKRKNENIKNSAKRKRGIELEDEDKEEILEQTEMTAEEEKNHSDELWKDFLKDTKTTTKLKAEEKEIVKVESQEKSKVYDFAGEKIELTEKGKTVASVKTESQSSPTTHVENKLSTPSPSSFPGKKTGGLGSILGKLSGKAPKLSTLEKSKLDWNEYKSDEGIEEELLNHNKGKDGYLERQAFLQRTDLRQFEIEKNLRLSNRR